MAVANRGYFVMLYVNVDREEKMRELFVQGKIYIEGAIILTPCIDDFRTKELNKGQIPYVTIGHTEDKISDSKYTVDVDNEEITYRIAAHLIKNGHRKILFLNSKENYTITNDRLVGYCRACAEAGIPIDKKNIFNVDENRDEAETLFKILHSRKEEYTACIVSSDTNARIVYDYAAKNGICIGSGLAVAALGGYERAEAFDPPLTMAKVDYDAMGRTASLLLCDILEGGAAEAESRSGEWSIDFRESSSFRLQL